MSFISRNDGLIKISDNNEILVADTDGRMLYYSYDNATYRRTLQNVFLKTYFEKNKRIVYQLNENESRYIVKRFYEKAKNVLFKDNIEKDFYEYLKYDAEKMKEIYKSNIPIVPPDQYFSIYVKITNGCSWNKCLFCDLYKNQKYSVIDFNSLKKEIHEINNYFGESIKSRKSVFIGDANAININNNLLIEYIKYIHEMYNLDIYSFMDVFITNKTKKLNDFIQMRDNGIKRLYIGLESGNVNVLKLLNKNIDVNNAINFISTIKSSGIDVGIIILAGAGGIKNYNNHVNDTVNFIEKLNLDKKDIIYLSRLIEHDEYQRKLNLNGIAGLTSDEMEEQVFEFKKLLNTNAKIAEYNIIEALY